VTTIATKKVMTFIIMLGLLFSHSTHVFAVQYDVYQVKEGDSLWKISQNYKVNVEEIKKINGLTGNLLHIGQKLKLPISAGSDNRYVVQKGDNLWTLAKNYNTTVSEIKNANSMRTDTLQIGQVLIMPTSTLASTSSAKNMLTSDSLDSLAINNSDIKRSDVKISSIDQTRSDQTKNNKITYSKQEYEWLARIIEAEAEDEPYLGKVAVGSVIINRIQDDWFPDTIEGVIFQKSKTVYQFSPVGNGRFNRVKPSKDSYKAATEALNGVDPTDGALYFYNPRLTSDKWIRTRTVVKEIGQHTFAY
jgi:N-acetylmuramoyl-L-alanine amidase